MPAIPWNQISGIIEIRFIRGNLLQGVKDSFEIASKIAEYVAGAFMFPDCRKLIFQPTRRTIDNSMVLRDPSHRER
jgi:hypothetical protein